MGKDSAHHPVLVVPLHLEGNRPPLHGMDLTQDAAEILREKMQKETRMGKPVRSAIPCLTADLGMQCWGSSPPRVSDG